MSGDIDKAWFPERPVPNENEGDIAVQLDEVLQSLLQVADCRFVDVGLDPGASFCHIITGTEDGHLWSRAVLGNPRAFLEATAFGNISDSNAAHPSTGFLVVKRKDGIGNHQIQSHGYCKYNLQNARARTKWTRLVPRQALRSGALRVP